MIDHRLEFPPDSLTAAFAICLASVTEVPLADVPPPADENLTHALGAWRTWLAERGSGLVPIAEPGRFQWAGWWIALVEDPADDQRGFAALAFGTPPGIVLSPQAPELLGRAVADLTVTAGYAVASLDPVLRPQAVEPGLRGTVEALAIAPAAEASMQAVESVRALAERGLEGDRYAAGAGTFSSRTRRPGYDLTMIAAEVLDELAAAGQPITFPRTRRNVLTRGLDVNALVGRTFRIGDVRCIGRRLCEPCAHLDRIEGPGLLRPLIHIGGLRVDVLSDGEIGVGAPIETD